MMMRVLVTIALLTGSLLPAFAADAKYQMFLQLPGVQGDCKVAGHVGEMELLGFSSLPALLGPSGSGKSTLIGSATRLAFNAPTQEAFAQQQGKPAEFNLVKWVDKSSVKLSSFCRSGKVFPSARLALCSAIGDKPVIMTFDLSNVRIASYTLWAPGFAPPEPLAEYDVAKDLAECLSRIRLRCDKLKGTIFANPEFATQPQPQ